MSRKSRFIASPIDPRRPAQTHEMLQLFGVKGGKWPAQGCKARPIQDIWVHVLPADHISLRRADGRRNNKHRVIASCPDCGRAVPAGRLQQHKCGSKLRSRVTTAFRTAELKVAKSRMDAAYAQTAKILDEAETACAPAPAVVE